MKNNKRKLKAIGLSMVLAAGMMLPASVSAQEEVAETGGGLLGYGKLFGSDGSLFNSRSGIPIDDEEEGITNEGIGQSPLGSGIVVLIGAGLGYAALKKKEDEQ